MISICEAFAAQDSDFVTSVEEGYDPDSEPRRRPTQLVYASSQSEMDKMFYKHYKTFSKAMLAGDRGYFVCDMICDTAIKTFMNGQPYKPLLTKDKVETALKANKEKALREYYNKPEQDGGVNQIVKWGTIRRNEKFTLPQLYHEPKNRIALAFDPARTLDNSILSAMKIVDDPELGLCGMMVNCVNLVDTATKKKFKLDSVRQIAELQQTLLNYNGQAPDYEHIEMLLIDQGAGGGGTSTYADGLLSNWKDRIGKEHRGLIDKSHEIYEGFDRRYPDAVDKLRLISPRRYRTQMVDEFIELMNLGVIWFPFEYSGQGSVLLPNGVVNGEEQFKNHELTEEEQLALVNLDLMKKEVTSIYKFENPERTTRTYALSKDKESKMHDDRFYTAIMLAHYLYELRRGHIMRRPKPVIVPDSAFEFRAPKLRSS